jgi:hypothetical protein
LSSITTKEAAGRKHALEYKLFKRLEANAEEMHWGENKGGKKNHLRLEVVAISPSKDQVAEQHSFFEL